MLVTCSSCNSNYLVNSADLKPNGRSVKCAKCGHSWFQEISLDQNKILDSSITSSKTMIDNNIEDKNRIANLPSTYVEKKEPKFINSLLIIILLIIIIYVFWLLKNNGMNLFVLINYYIQEFYFNLKLIINDLAKVIYQILN